MNGHSSDSPTYVILIVSECQKFFYTVQCTAIYSWSTPPHLVALLLLTALLLAALLAAPPLLLPHTAPLLQHSSPTLLLPCITLHRRLVFGCFVVRQPPPSSADAIELARVRGAEAWLQLAARGAWRGECAKIWNRRTDSIYLTMIFSQKSGSGPRPRTQR